MTLLVKFCMVAITKVTLTRRIFPLTGKHLQPVSEVNQLIYTAVIEVYLDSF